MCIRWSKIAKKFSIIPCLYQEKVPKGGAKKDKCHRKCALDGPKSRKMPEILFRWYNLRCQKISEKSPKYYKGGLKYEKDSLMVLKWTLA